MAKWEPGRYIIQMSQMGGVDSAHHFMKVFDEGRVRKFQIDIQPVRMLDKEALEDLRDFHIRYRFPSNENPSFSDTKITVTTECHIHEFFYQFNDWSAFERFLKKFPGVQKSLDHAG
ncbi:MAG: hypothetical protein HWE07_00710 [Cytophagia bacterium]|nr:hypothetical protein [Cytophagia bacterium]